MKECKLFFVLLFLIIPIQAYSESLTIEIAEIKEKKGQILIGLYNNTDNFPLISKNYKGIFIQATAYSIRYTFSDIPKGSYAIAVIHDENNNNELDKNIIGIPTEGYGFSNNPTIIMNAPSFEEAKFYLNKEMTVKIKLNY